MKIVKRTLILDNLLKKKSYFLFGPRGVGKSFLVRQCFGEHVTTINLLRPEVYLRLAAEPHMLREIISGSAHAETKEVVIDEIQKIPLLLDEVHRLIEEEQMRFLLTGSSARKLRHGGVNLLAGRARIANLFPFSAGELQADFDLDRYLRYGGLPAVYFSTEPEEELQAYVATYLQEEIKAEGLIRKVPVFSSFLRATALSSGQALNFTKFASDLEVSSPTVREYFSILEDTLIGTIIQPWRGSKKRKATASGKFYFFDPGVTHTLAGTKHLDPNSNLYGQAFEQWIFMELRAWASYRRFTDELSFWRVDEDCEVDFLLGNRMAIEAKATTRLRSSDFRGLISLHEELTIEHRIIVSRDPVRRLHEGILCLPYRDFIEWLWRQT